MMNVLEERAKFYLVKYDRLLKLFTANFLLRGGVVAINLGTGILMRKVLGESNSGLFGLFIGALILFNTALNFGFNGSAMYFAKKRPEKLHQYLTTNFIITLISIVVIVFALFFSSFFFKFQSSLLNIIFILCYIVYSFSQIYRSFLIGMDENLYMQKLDLFTRSIYGIFILILYYFEFMSVLNLVSFMCCEYALFTWLAHKKSNLKIWPLQWDMSFFKENILFNSKSYIVGVLYIILLKGDQFIIKAFYNNYQVGVYGIGGTIVENMFMVTAIISTMYVPKLLDNDDYLQIIQKSKKLLALIFIISVGMAGVVYIFAPFLYQMYFDKIDIEGTYSLRTLLIGFISLSLFIFNNYIYFSIRLKKSLIIILAIGVALNLLLNYIYLPSYGIIASAWSSSICYTLVAMLSIFDLYYLKKKNYIKKTLVSDEERL
jgi:O-antigen/teichoic acid export membrane protein